MEATDFVSMTQGIDLNLLTFGPGGVITSVLRILVNHTLSQNLLFVTCF